MREKTLLTIALFLVNLMIINHLIYQVPTKAVAYENITGLEVEIVPVVKWSEERIKKEIDTMATKYGVSSEVMNVVIKCESEYNIKALGDGGKSRGLSQIHSYYHPDVLDEEAYNPEFAIEFLAEKLSKGEGYLWSCYNMNYSNE